MTREEIIEQLENAIGLIKQDGKDWLDDRDIPMLEACIKALEQEPLLDIQNVRNALSAGVECVAEEAEKIEKIRAEIATIRDSWKKDCYHDEADALTLVLQIIDKYAEQEPAETRFQYRMSES